ncbi:MAG: uracil-DNA glycosylase [Magnetococcales bacterium]|nr:uracil-DNA glycosylase [Magnetococcales bacterium]
MESTPKAWQATLAYWLECGLMFRSGSQLEFHTPPPRVRGGPSLARPSLAPPVLPVAPEERPPAPHRPLSSWAVPGDAGGSIPAQSQPPPPPPQEMIGARIETPLPALVPAAERPAVLARMATEVADCAQCPLAKTRTQTVFGVGTAEASVCFVGEGPGAEEDLRGEPFVGAAGRLLDQMLHAIALERSQVFIANVVKCRPPGNRNPHTEEVLACQDYLFRQLEIIRPKVIFCLGKFALLCLTGHAEAVGQARGRSFSWRGIPVIASFHPAYYLRTPSRKRAAWEDLLRLMKQLHQTE